ncbi:MAG: C39 family peptidase [Simkaniaceae bacterium]|nr:C39 family peptidase [Simkaniaceae bacterium]
MQHHIIDKQRIISDTYLWEVQNIFPLKELILTWNGERPESGSSLFEIKTEEKWIPYAEWGPNFQRTLSDFQDVFPANGARQFSVRVSGSLLNLRSLHITAGNFTRKGGAVGQFSGLSQMALADPRANRLCSPTSTAAVLRHYNCPVDPLIFARCCYDSGHDIYGNWVLAMAEASNLLGAGYRCYVTRCDFSSLRGPAPVSVKGQLPGAPKAYNSGHLMVYLGYNAQTQMVSCMDPAFSRDEKTLVSYPLESFLNAWNGIAYIMERQ